MKPNVYCIIVTYNSIKFIERCLCSLRQSTIVPNIIVVDNNSKDNTIPFIKEYFPEIYLVENSQNKGFGQANNQGIEIAIKLNASHFFLLNHDVYVKENTIEKLIEVQDLYKLSITSPIHLNESGFVIDSGFRNYLLRSKNINTIFSDYLRGELMPYYEVETINAACWMISKETIVKVGGFDPIFFHYGEDINYCQRIHYHGGNIAFIPNIYIHHDRNEKGNIEVYNTNAVRASLLKLSADVNNKSLFFNITIVRYYLHIVKLLLINLIKLNFKSVNNLISDSIFLIKNRKMIKRSYKKNRSINNNWLNI